MNGSLITTGHTGMATEVKRLLLIGDRFLLLDALRLALQRDGLDVAAIGTGRQTMEDALRAFDPQVVLLDGSAAPIEATVRSIRWLHTSGRTVMGIAAESISVEAAQLARAGAACVLGLEIGLDDLIGAIGNTLQGGVTMPLSLRYELEELHRRHLAHEQRRWLPFQELTDRERDIFARVYNGLGADQIADEACVSVSTVRTHIRSILTKLNVNSQLAAVAMARSNGWFSVDGLGEVG